MCISTVEGFVLFAEHRYIELFLKSTPGGSFSGDGGGGIGARGGMGGNRGGMGRRMGGGIGMTLSEMTDFAEDDDFSFGGGMGGAGGGGMGGGMMNRMNRMGNITPMGLMNKGGGGNMGGGMGMGGDMMGIKNESGFGMGSSLGRGSFNGDGAMKRGIWHRHQRSYYLVTVFCCFCYLLVDGCTCTETSTIVYGARFLYWATEF